MARPHRRSGSRVNHVIQAASPAGFTAPGPNLSRSRSATSSIRRDRSSAGSKVSWREARPASASPSARSAIPHPGPLEPEGLVDPVGERGERGRVRGGLPQRPAPGQRRVTGPVRVPHRHRERPAHLPLAPQPRPSSSVSERRARRCCWGPVRRAGRSVRRRASGRRRSGRPAYGRCPAPVPQLTPGPYAGDPLEGGQGCGGDPADGVEPVSAAGCGPWRVPTPSRAAAGAARGRPPPRPGPPRRWSRAPPAGPPSGPPWGWPPPQIAQSTPCRASARTRITEARSPTSRPK
ncbi:hypothetical protein SMICM304S_00647 [Streptomyces microflavus]